METEPESSPRAHLASVPLRDIHCPRCGAYSPKQTMTFRDLQTGEKNIAFPQWHWGCLISFLVFIAFWVVSFVVFTILNNILHPSEFSTFAGIEYLFVFFLGPIGSILAALIAIPLYLAWRRNRLSKTYVTVRHFVCRQCKHEWTMTQGPASSASHESESASTVNVPALPAEEATPVHQTALPAPLLSLPILGRPKRRRSPVGPVSMMLLVLLLLGGLYFGIYHAILQSPPVTSNRLQAVAWSGSEFVVVGDLGTILTSPDGHTWRTQTSGTLVYLWDVACSGSECVTVGENGTILTSPGGSTWTTQTSGTSSDLNEIVWSGSEFVTVGYNGPILTSPDGSTWTTQTSGPSGILNLAWSGSEFVAVGHGGAILTSLDGSTWTTQTSGASNSLNGVVWSGSELVAVGENGTILTSPDGHTWRAQTSDTLSILNGVAWSGSEFVVVGNDGIILTSPEGHAWAAQTSGTSNNLLVVAWSGSEFVAVGDNRTILTSPDGRTWTAQNAGTSQNLSGVARSGSQVVAVGGPWHSSHLALI